MEKKNDKHDERLMNNKAYFVLSSNVLDQNNKITLYKKIIH